MTYDIRMYLALTPYPPPSPSVPFRPRINAQLLRHPILPFWRARTGRGRRGWDGINIFYLTLWPACILGAEKLRSWKRKRLVCTYRCMYRVWVVPELNLAMTGCKVGKVVSRFCVDLPGISMTPIAITWGARGIGLFGLLCTIQIRLTYLATYPHWHT